MIRKDLWFHTRQSDAPVHATSVSSLKKVHEGRDHGILSSRATASSSFSSSSRLGRELSRWSHSLNRSPSLPPAAGLGDGAKTPPGAALARRFSDKIWKMLGHKNEWTTGGGALTSSSMMVTAGSNGSASAKTKKNIIPLAFFENKKKIAVRPDLKKKTF